MVYMYARSSDESERRTHSKGDQKKINMINATVKTFMRHAIMMCPCLLRQRFVELLSVFSALCLLLMRWIIVIVLSL